MLAIMYVSTMLTHIQELVGKVTGSEPWTSSGGNDKEAGVSAMKQAGAQRDASTQGYGKVEELAGKAAGCEGMVEEGKESKTS